MHSIGPPSEDAQLHLSPDPAPLGSLQSITLNRMPSQPDGSTPSTSTLEQRTTSLFVGPYYLMGRMGRAATTVESDSVDPDARERAKEKIKQYQQTIEGILTGTLTPGSRAPIFGTPHWLTPVVVKGGFATGDLAAGGALTSYERKQAAAMGMEKIIDDRVDTIRAIRSKLNDRWLTFSDSHFPDLCNMLDSGNYRIRYPEESVALILAALIRSEHFDEATKLAETIAPFKGEVRFFPEPAETPMPTDLRVTMKSLPAAMALLENRFGPAPERISSARRRIETQTLVLSQWLPLKERLLALLLETVDGDLPHYKDGVVCGGLPLKKIDQHWQAKARQYREDRKQLLKQHPELKCRTAKKRGSERMLHNALETILAHPQVNLHPDESEKFQVTQEKLRKTLANAIHKRGLPGSEKFQQKQQERHCLLAKRQQQLSHGQSLIALLSLFEERIPADLEIDTTGLPLKVKCLLDKIRPRTVPELLERGDIGSAELLARKNLEISPLKGCEVITDQALATLSAQVEQAFNRRRSLLLLDLGTQVTVDELPWVQALRAITPIDQSKNAELANKLIRETVTQTFEYFPQTILTNVFLKSLKQFTKGLASHQTINFPLTEELASDIFMHRFSDKYLHAAIIASHLMQGTLYEKYYGLDYVGVSELKTADKFYEECLKLSGAYVHSRSWFDRDGSEHLIRNASPSNSGKVIEWQQIITTHNLATLTDALNLQELLAGEYGHKLSEKVTNWLVQQLSTKPKVLDNEAILHRNKNIAYALRQLLFFMSFQPVNEQFVVLNKLKSIPQHQANPQADRLISRLEAVITNSVTEQEKPFVGWL